MKYQVIIFHLLLFLSLSCANQDVETENDKQEEKKIETKNLKKNNKLSINKDSLIAELAYMKTDTLDCSADIYWKIIAKGKAYIPKLIESLTDTTLTNIYHECKKGKLNIGELSYFALEEIGDFPAFVVTQIQFDTFDIQNGWNCWSFYDYLFDNKNKKEYQEKVKAFYKKSKFEFFTYPDSVMTDCMKDYSIRGKYQWKK